MAGIDCRSRITGAGLLAEPYVAADPTRPDRLVAGTNTVGAQVESLSFHVSDDGGATWSDLDVPLPSRRGFDPVVHFDPDGTLFVVGIIHADAFLNRAIGYAVSPDGGDTWTESGTVGPDAGAPVDRPWIDSSGNATMLAWQVVNDGSGVAHFGADGALVGTHAFPECTNGSVAFLDSWRVACVGQDGGVIYESIAATGPWFRNGTLPGDASHTPVLRAGEGHMYVFDNPDRAARLWIHEGMKQWIEIDLGITVAESRVGGVNGALPNAATRVMWAEADPTGALHVLVRAREACAHGPLQATWACGASAVHHIMIEPSEPARVVVREQVSPELARTRAPTSDDYHGIAFWDGAGVFVYGDQGGVWSTSLARPAEG